MTRSCATTAPLTSRHGRLPLPLLVLCISGWLLGTCRGEEVDPPDPPLLSRCEEAITRAKLAGGVFADMGDGDQKQIVFEEAAPLFTITPYGNNQSWEVKANLDHTACNATVDFHVAGKPSPPPVKELVATVYLVTPPEHEQFAGVMIQWTDPSGYLSPPTYPIGAWLLLPPKQAP
jgi:hypothetical protein